jgi:hypothetical protein
MTSASDFAPGLELRDGAHACLWCGWPFRGPAILSERYNEIDDTIAETPAMSFRGLCVKARLAQITCEEPTGWDATIALSIGADFERLAGKGGAS